MRACAKAIAAAFVIAMSVQGLPLANAETPEPPVVGGPTGTIEQPPPSRESLPLGAQSNASAAPGENSSPKPSGNTSWLLRSMVGLGVVLGLALLLRLLIGNVSARNGSLRSQLGAGGRAPSGILEVLARYPIARSQTLVLLRVDKRILLLSQGANGFQTLSEVNDPESVASIISQADDDAGESMTARFNDLLREVESETVEVATTPVHQARQVAHKAGDTRRDEAVGAALRQMRGVKA